MGKNLRQFSQQEWSSTSGDGASVPEIGLGCLQRIADANEARVKQNDRWLEIIERRTQAIEAQAKDKIALLHQVRELTLELEGQKKVVSELANSYTTGRLAIEHLYRRISALRGVITKLKGKLAGK